MLSELKHISVMSYTKCNYDRNTTIQKHTMSSPPYYTQIHTHYLYNVYRQ